jgi:hypothetical protein
MVTTSMAIDQGGDRTRPRRRSGRRPTCRVIEIFNQGGDRRVERRQLLFQALLDVVVVVPVARVDGDAGAAGL